MGTLFASCRLIKRRAYSSSRYRASLVSWRRTTTSYPTGVVSTFAGWRCTQSMLSHFLHTGVVLGRCHPDLRGAASYSIGVVPHFAKQHRTRSAPSRSLRSDVILDRRCLALYGAVPYSVGVVPLFTERCYTQWVSSWSSQSGVVSIFAKRRRTLSEPSQSLWGDIFLKEYGWLCWPWCWCDGEQ